MMERITQEQALECLEYRDGRLFWKKITRANHTRIGAEAGNHTALGYRVVRVLGRIYKSHQLIFLMHHGRFATEIDHIDGDRSNNRIENLREVTHQQNMENRKIGSNNTSGVKGVYWHALSGKWQARLRRNKGTIYNKLFDSLEDAAEAIKIARERFHGEYARHEVVAGSI